MSKNEAMNQWNIGEAIVITLLTKLGISAVKNNDYALRYDYDLLCKYEGREFTIEVKFDKYAGRSRNLAVETHNTKSDSPSGIMVTKADLWVQIVGTEKDVNVVSTQKLKNFVRDEVPYKIIECGGDANARLYLYKFDHILPIFRKLSLENLLEELNYNE